MLADAAAEESRASPIKITLEKDEGEVGEAGGAGTDAGAAAGMITQPIARRIDLEAIAQGERKLLEVGSSFSISTSSIGDQVLLASGVQEDDEEEEVEEEDGELGGGGGGGDGRLDFGEDVEDAGVPREAPAGMMEKKDSFLLPTPRGEALMLSNEILRGIGSPRRLWLHAGLGAPGQGRRRSMPEVAVLPPNFAPNSPLSVHAMLPTNDSDHSMPPDFSMIMVGSPISAQERASDLTSSLSGNLIRTLSPYHNQLLSPRREQAQPGVIGANKASSASLPDENGKNRRDNNNNNDTRVGPKVGIEFQAVIPSFSGNEPDDSYLDKESKINVPLPIADFEDQWIPLKLSVDDIHAFNNAVFAYGKDFRVMKNQMPELTLRNIIEFYYVFWKFSPAHWKYKLAKNSRDDEIGVGQFSNLSENGQGSSVSPEEEGFDLLHIIQNGLGIMEPGKDVLSVSFKGHLMSSTLRPDGTIEDDGKIFSSPNEWSLFVKQKHEEDNGWETVHYRHRSLQYFRETMNSFRKGSDNGKAAATTAAAAAVTTTTGALQLNENEENEGDNDSSGHPRKRLKTT